MGERMERANARMVMARVIPGRFREGLPGSPHHGRRARVPPQAPGGSRLGCRDPSPTTPLSERPECKRPENKPPD